jgi:hypothetical protein
MRVRILTVISFAFASIGLAAQEHKPDASMLSEIPTAFVVQGTLYHAARDWSQKEDNWYHPVLLRKVDLRTGTEATGPKTYRVSVYNKPSNPLCWRIAHGCFWETAGAATMRIPLDELILFDRWDEKARALNKARYPKFPTMANAHDWPLTRPMAEMWSSWKKEESYRLLGPYGVFDHFQDTGLIKRTYFDFVPLSPDKVRLFVLSPDKYYGVFDVWDENGTWSKETESWKVTWSKQPTEHFKSYFLDPFVMYAKDSTYLFMPPSGKYYLSEDPVERDKLLERSTGFLPVRYPEKGKRDAHPHWLGGGGVTQSSEYHPAQAVIVDVDTDETYVFLRPPKESSDKTALHYFALSSQPQIKTYSRPELKPASLEEPLKTLVQYTQLLIDKGKIRIK